MKERATLEEVKRLSENQKRTVHWKRWGPYLSERQWGTVREDYSNNSDAWGYFPFEHSASRAYRWGEDGLLGITDSQCRLCFAIALWNEKDPILKERLFGLAGPEGNHGEDVKELYYYLDSTPTHSYMRAMYRYPQSRFPYESLKQENRGRSKLVGEFELTDTGVFSENKFFEVEAQYAKADCNDLYIRIVITNRGAETAPIHVIPTLWFRNTWIWGCRHEGCTVKPSITVTEDDELLTSHENLESFRFAAGPASSGALGEWIFTENETNTEKLFGVPTYTRYVKDAFHRYIVRGEADAISPQPFGTKVGRHYKFEIPANQSVTIPLRLYSTASLDKGLYALRAERTFTQRKQEADEFFESISEKDRTSEQTMIERQAYAGLFWSKQFYHYVIEDWLDGDPDAPPPPDERRVGRNSDWRHLFNRDVVMMPDKWEYPWYAAWDLAFHAVAVAKADPDLAKEQLALFLREWYMHPSGQIPAYEWNFSDVNPPVHAWGCWKTYQVCRTNGQGDRRFLASVFPKLLVNFTWWVNRKDVRQNHLFSGGFLGLDNIGVFDRSKPLPTGGHLEQADGTAWMAAYCNQMLIIALELARTDPAMEDIASKFFEHFVHITHAINTFGGTGLWDDVDGFYYDRIHLGHEQTPLRLRSMVGLVPLIAAESIDCELLNSMPGFKKRFEWFLKNEPKLSHHVSRLSNGQREKYLLSVLPRERLERVLSRMLDEHEFLSPFGIRSLSKTYAAHPFSFEINGEQQRVSYQPGESDSYLFGGNSNWRGPIWFPLNFLLIEALERYHGFYGDTFTIECPTGSGVRMNLHEVSQEISRRLVRLFMKDASGKRPCFGDCELHQTDHEGMFFHEYFHAETGKGLGASHQTGWTALVTNCLDMMRR